MAAAASDENLEVWFQAEAAIDQAIQGDLARTRRGAGGSDPDRHEHGRQRPIANDRPAPEEVRKNGVKTV